MLAQPQSGGRYVLRSYRLYCFDGAGKISAAEWLKAADDEDAERQARERKSGVVEVWDRSRLVARVEVGKTPD